ncbi:hypothetical protein SAMN02745702_01323 [Desulfobaculum bizertense DSM 18034]|uniref:Uncharacterized protein n=1 Tax=Desulfobaculum bizertense DSM 18034 TaxID=1121442 RepID=A0A1T4VZC4_9BACT|nr:hypothetical protein SAMN02745702_01323 [Desulfobaculum bizertense DSM 18034]
MSKACAKSYSFHKVGTVFLRDQTPEACDFCCMILAPLIFTNSNGLLPFFSLFRATGSLSQAPLHNVALNLLRHKRAVL